MVTQEETAPGSLALVQAFMGTAFGHGKREDFLGAADVRDWFMAHALLPAQGQVTEGDFRRAVAFREALRALLRANNDAPLDPAAIAHLNYLAMGAPLRVHFTEDGRAALEPESGGVDGALGTLLGAVFGAMKDGTWNRLKACANERCERVYYDTSKNHTRRWCSMATCGTRSKVHAYRTRQHHDS